VASGGTGTSLPKRSRTREKRLRNDEAVPGVEDPGALNGNVECAHGNAGKNATGDWAGLNFVARAAGTVEAEGDCPALPQGAAQAEQGAHGVAAAGAFDGDESEFVDDASHVFAVVAVTAHHADSAIAKKVSRGDDAGVPEIEDERALGDGVLRAIFAGDADAQGGTDEADEPVSEENDDAQDDALAEAEARAAGGNFRCGGRFTSAGFGHEDIVMAGAHALDTGETPALHRLFSCPDKRRSTL